MSGKDSEEVSRSHFARIIGALTPKSREDKFWRSHQGYDAYDALTEAHFAKLIADLGKIGVRHFPATTWDVVVFEGIDGPDTFTAMTKGLGAFILAPPCHAESRKCFRQEFVWTFRGAEMIEGSVQFLNDMGDHVLEGRHWYMDGDVVRGIDIAKYSGHPCSMRNMVVKQGFYLEEAHAVIDNHYDCLFMELVPVGDEEAAWIDRDPEGFYDACEASGLDFLDLRRPTLSTSRGA